MGDGVLYGCGEGAVMDKYVDTRIYPFLLVYDCRDVKEGGVGARDVEEEGMEILDVTRGELEGICKNGTMSVVGEWAARRGMDKVDEIFMGGGKV